MCEEICCKATAANTHRKIHIPNNLLKKKALKSSLEARQTHS